MRIHQRHFVGSASGLAANSFLKHHGARHRKRSENQLSGDGQAGGSGTATAAGASIDGIS
jgi:hypothetical protein